MGNQLQNGKMLLEINYWGSNVMIQQICPSDKGGEMSLSEGSAFWFFLDHPLPFLPRRTTPKKLIINE